jgi:hypothetical protein
VDHIILIVNHSQLVTSINYYSKSYGKRYSPKQIGLNNKFHIIILTMVDVISCDVSKIISCQSNVM